MPPNALSNASLADLIEAVQSSGFTDVQKRDRISAIRTVARVLDSEPADLPLNVRLLRRRLDEVSPEAQGMTLRRWNNVRSLVNRSLELKIPVATSVRKISVSPAWKALAEALSRSKQLRLGALLRFLSARGVEPETVTVDDLQAFGEEIIENRLRAKAEDTWDGVVWTWNKCVAEVDGWPQVLIPRENRRNVYVRPWSDFPASLEADVRAYMKVLGGEVLDEEGPLRPLRASTLANRAYQFRAAASALAAAGVPEESICSLADIARLEPIKLILNQMLHRGEREHKAGTFNVANTLKACARYWVKIEDEELVKIGRLASRLSPRQKGLTEKNRSRLMPLNDPEQVRRFLRLPFVMANELKAHPRRNAVDAVSAQLAAAIAILQAVPLRISNLAALDLEEHLVERGGRIFIRIDGHQVKNGSPYEMELPRDVADLIAWYCLKYRDLLVHAPTTALFPGEGAGPKTAQTLARQISERAERRLGWPVNAHLFRHISAKLYLDRRPGEYGVVSRLLNHQSVTTTMRAYTGAETASAVSHFQSVVADLRGEVPKRRRAAR